MPYIYSYLQALLNHQQAMKLRFNETEVKFNADVERECRRVSNNICAFENIDKIMFAIGSVIFLNV